MGSDKSNVSEEFIRMIQVLADDPNLSMWFISLESLADNARFSVLGSMVEQMKANNEQQELIEAVQSVMDPVIYGAALKTLRKLLGFETKQ